MAWLRDKQSLAARDELEPRVQEIGRQLLTAARRHQEKGLWSERLIAWALEDEALKTELFRFIDVFPVLKTPAAIHQHLVEYLQQPGVKLPTSLAAALKAGGLLKGTLAHTVEGQIRGMAQRFIAGQSLADAAPVLRARWQEGIAFSLDLLGEAVVSHAEAAAYRRRYLEMIEQLAELVASFPSQPALETDHLGPIPRGNVSIKISALDGHVSPVDGEATVERLHDAIAPLLEIAAAKNVFINFDMEHHALKEMTIRLFKRCCETHDFSAGLALQAYLRSAEDDARDLVEWSRAQGRIVTVRLIKGAYWDYETLHAQMQNWPPPVWATKGETDACFERATDYLLQETPRDKGAAGGRGRGGVKLAVGTHNARSMAHAVARLESLRLPANAIEFQTLRGMAEELKQALIEGAGMPGDAKTASRWRVREYTPIGELIPGMAYLVRRLLENTSNEGWLRAGHSGQLSDEQLLAMPETHPAAVEYATESPAAAAEFRNEPLRDWSQAEVREHFRDTVTAAKVAAIASDGTPADAKRAIDEAAAAFPAWRDREPGERADIIRRAAAIMHDSRDSLAALIVHESQKTWSEADADVCEAIDFCRYYAAESLQLFAPEPIGTYAGPGELNHFTHEARGVAAVISPWNFPLSIPTGMTVAALVTGNTAILKPAEQTPAIARELCNILWLAGVPREVLHFLPAPGETTGAALVRDPRVSIIAFTGSAAVGLDILRSANARQSADSGGQPAPQVQFVPRIICEMGGKNAMIVDASADMDEAVAGVRQSAFSYAGQKCSAGSRLILVDSIHDAFLARLVEATHALVLGDPADPATDIGPVIDDQAADRIARYIAIGKQETRLVYPSPTAPASPAIPATAREVLATAAGRLIAPHIFADVLPADRLAREEIFGPVLAVLRARDFSDALALANDSAYKLTGGLFSRTPSHILQARQQFRVGNLYINRGITGALVGRQPFGGFGLSGVGAKAGGRDYLQQFTDSRIVTENTMRRGFAPAPIQSQAGRLHRPGQ